MAGAPGGLKSNQWSCGSLAAGNKNLLEIKREVDARRAELEAMEREMSNMELVAKPVTPEEMQDTVPATDSQIEEATGNGQKRAPPLSTQTTPVKSLSAPKRTRQEPALMTSVKSKAGPKKAPVIPGPDGGDVAEDGTVANLQKQLADALQLINVLKGSGSASTTPGSPTVTSPGVSSTPQSTASTSIPPPKAVQPAGSPTGEADVDLTDEDGLKRYKRIDAQLRRLCERKPSGRLNVPLSVHEMWMKGGKDRDELRMMFEQFELNKEKFVTQVVKTIERKTEDTHKVKRGWFTAEAMKTELKWSGSYIKDVTAYCKKHGLVKNDKYSSKVFKYFVEYAETETTKKSHTEKETTTTTGEGEAEVALSGDWHVPTRPEADDDQEAQTPEDGEMEVETKFSNGLLAKMSKITDLISKLEGLEGVSADDKGRVSKLVSSMEVKMQAAQEAFDAFEDARSRLGDTKRTPENTVQIKKAMTEAMGKASALASVEAQGKALFKVLTKKLKEWAEAEE